MRELGAEVVLSGADFDAAKDEARAYAGTRPEFVFVEDGDEPLIAEGAGTIAVELAPLDLDAIVVPVGNGALISGIGCWTKARSPRTRIIGVRAAGAPAMATSWRTGVPETTGPVCTMADGIAVRVPVPAAVACRATRPEHGLTCRLAHERQRPREVGGSGDAGLSSPRERWSCPRGSWERHPFGAPLTESRSAVGPRGVLS